MNFFPLGNHAIWKRHERWHEWHRRMRGKEDQIQCKNLDITAQTVPDGG
jgi:hypothetical protein